MTTATFDVTTVELERPPGVLEPGLASGRRVVDFGFLRN